MLTGTTAQALHDEARALGVLLVWLVSDADPGHPGKVVARPLSNDIRNPSGGDTEDPSTLLP
jgi:hypothetical protein